MKGLFKISNRTDKKIYNLTEVQNYLDKVEGIRVDRQISAVNLWV